MKYQSLFSEKNKKNITNLPCAEFAHRVVKVKIINQQDQKPLSCWARIYPAFANSVGQDQLASEANWSESALFAIKYVNLFGSSNLIGWKLEVGVAS